MEPDEILQDVRKKIREHAGEDPDKWFYANRYVFARLSLDERKTKAGIKKHLLDSNVACHSCGKQFEIRLDVNIHRLDGTRGYTDDNCVLMHSACHRQFHANTEKQKETGDPSGRPRKPDIQGNAVSHTPRQTRARKVNPNGILFRESKRYDQGSYLYWWDIAPNLQARFQDFEAIEFIKGDSRERGIIDTEVLLPYLENERRTSRGSGNWGIKVLKGREEELAMEPGKRGQDWLFIPVVWMSDDED